MEWIEVNDTVYNSNVGQDDVNFPMDIEVFIGNERDQQQKPTPSSNLFVCNTAEPSPSTAHRLGYESSSSPATNSDYSPTSSVPSTVAFKGDFHFEANFSPFSYKNWDYSKRLNKLYTDMNKWVQVRRDF